MPHGENPISKIELTENMTHASCLLMSTSGIAVSKLVPKTKRGVRTRAALLRAAEKCFGDRGFDAVSISDIAEEAGVAVGTFYLYFTDKLGVFRAVVDLIQIELRQHLRSQRRNAVAGDRLSRERQGLNDFLVFASDRPKMFRILQESYIVDSDIYFAYFESIAASYARQLKVAQSSKQIVKGDPHIQAWCLMAIGNFLGMRLSRAGMRKSKREAIVNEIADFMTFGLAPEGRRRADLPVRAPHQRRQRK